MDNYTDEQLAEIAQTGNNEALEILVARYIKLVYNFCFSYAKNQQDAEDITQDVFIKVWRKLNKFEKTKTFRPWLYAIAKNTALDFLKKKSVLPFAALNESGETEWLGQAIIDESLGPELLTDRELLTTKLSGLLKKLSPKYAEVLSLYFNDQLNFREIAEQKHESLNTVKSRYRRALANLKKLL